MNNIEKIKKYLIIDYNIIQKIYNTTLKLKFNPHYTINFPFTNKTALEYLKDIDYRDFSYEICFLLTSLYEKAILNRGLLTFNNIETDYFWIEIFYDNIWYSFNPFTNEIYEKNIFDILYQSKIFYYFTSGTIKTKLIYNMFFPDKIPNKDLINKIYNIIPNKGIILPSNNENDLTYGISFIYTLKKKQNNISSINASII